MDLYVYYRVKPEAASALQKKVLAMQAGLAARHGVKVGLKRRPEEKSGEQTWMETYYATPQGFTAELDAAAAEAELAQHTSGPRHTEVFVDLPPCA
jgi:hypothetical protein